MWIPLVGAMKPVEKSFFRLPSPSEARFVNWRQRESKTLAEDTSSANQLLRPGDHTVNDSALCFCEEGFNFKTRSSYSNSGFKYINHIAWKGSILFSFIRTMFIDQTCVYKEFDFSRSNTQEQQHRTKAKIDIKLHKFFPFPRHSLSLYPHAAANHRLVDEWPECLYDYVHCVCVRVLPGHPGAGRRRPGCTWPIPPRPTAAASWTHTRLWWRRSFWSWCRRSVSEQGTWSRRVGLQIWKSSRQPRHDS